MEWGGQLALDVVAAVGGAVRVLVGALVDP